MKLGYDETSFIVKKCVVTSDKTEVKIKTEKILSMQRGGLYLKLSKTQLLNQMV